MGNDWPRAVLFDLDGTLVESLADILAALNGLLDEAGLRPLSVQEMKPMTGDGAGALIERAFAFHGAPTPAHGLERFKTLYGEAVCVETHLYPGVLAVLQELQQRGCKLGVATNKPAEHARAVLRALSVDHLFAAVAGGDSYPARKPDPKHLLLLLEELGIPALAGVMVGDSENDVYAAQAAGLPVVVCSFGYSKLPVGQLGGDLIIDRFDALPAALEALAANQVARSSS
ncbi:MAG: HAD-IA family hydrolase [Kiloniellales bacterium]